MVSGCDMTGPVPAGWEFSQLVHLDFSNNSLTGSFAPLANSSTLENMDLSNNQLSGSPLFLHAAPSLRFARLSGNAGITGPLNGTVPATPGAASVATLGAVCMGAVPAQTKAAKALTWLLQCQ